MSEESLRARIGEAMPRFRPAERRAATLLLTEGARYPDISLRELAAAADVSQSAVVNMCKRIGLSGFRSFRLQWVKEASRTAALRRPHTSIFENLYGELAQTEAMLQHRFTDASRAIANARQVYICGGRGSGAIADLAAESFAVHGRMAVAFHEDDRLTASLAHITPDSVWVVVSHRGENEQLRVATVQAKEKGAAVIVLTSRAGSSLGELADILLVTTAPEGYGQALVTSGVRAVQMAVIHALVDSLEVLRR